MSRDDEILRKAKYQKYLSEDELLLCDTERERLVIQRELVDLGMLSEMDLMINNLAYFKGKIERRIRRMKVLCVPAPKEE